MGMEQASLDVRKAMAYDLLLLLKTNENKTYTVDELEKMINDYIKSQIMQE